MIGQTLGHYRIVEKIGEGGMGVVYRAHDERLERHVAVKVLPEGTLADEASHNKFRQEALALSKLNHPNVATVHDFDTQDGVDFLAMEYIPGQTLTERVASGPLPEKEIAQLGTALVDGLAAAHAQGLVHRDLKPGNVRITPDGLLKILDFGLARTIGPVGESALTQTASELQGVAGTLPYMAPEQLRGEPLDARTDLYAAGVVLYEMATGQRPFEEKLATALAADIQTKPPQTPRAIRPALSSRLEEIILKCLEKEPENRYQSAKELVVDLRRLGTPAVAVQPETSRRAQLWWAIPTAALAVVATLAALFLLNVAGLRDSLLGSPAPAPGQISSLAVLPLDNLSGDPEQAYFVDGMHDALIADLAKLGALKVISRQSVIRYQDTDKSAPEIAQELEVDAIVEGSVLRAGDRVRITAQMIDGVTDEHIWVQSYERDLTDILALQREVARAIAAEIRVAVSTEEEARLSHVRPVKPEAHALFLKARHLVRQQRTSRAAVEQSIDLYQDALRLDPDYAPAYAALAGSYLNMTGIGYILSQEAVAQARPLLERAIDLDPTLGDAYYWLGFMNRLEWDWDAAEEHFRRARELSPNAGLPNYARLLLSFGRHEEAIAEMRRAQELDPFNPAIHVAVCSVLYSARQYDRAIEECRKTLALNPEHVSAKFVLGRIYTAMGRYEDAIAELLSRRVASPGTNWVLGYTYGLAGRPEEAHGVLNFLLERSTEQFIWPEIIAFVYAGLGEKDRAFEWLEKSFEGREFWLTTLQVNPLFDPLRSDPRFQDLLRRMNFPE